MKTVATLLFFAFYLTVFAQTTTEKLVGTWELKRHILYTGDTCGSENKFEITFNKDFTFVEMVNGFPITGKWKIVENKIMYYDNRAQDTDDGAIADHAYVFRISANGELIEEDYVCDELGGTSFYRKE